MDDVADAALHGSLATSCRGWSVPTRQPRSGLFAYSAEQADTAVSTDFLCFPVQPPLFLASKLRRPGDCVRRGLRVGPHLGRIVCSIDHVVEPIGCQETLGAVVNRALPHTNRWSRFTFHREEMRKVSVLELRCHSRAFPTKRSRQSRPRERTLASRAAAIAAPPAAH